MKPYEGVPGEITERPVSMMITVIDFRIHYYGFTVIAIHVHVYFTHTVVTVGMVRYSNHTRNWKLCGMQEWVCVDFMKP